MGQIDLNITDLGVDFYVSNGHKWMYSPKGSAILWVRYKL
jgi:isopenicillin-N epimerase